MARAVEQWRDQPPAQRRDRQAVPWSQCAGLVVRLGCGRLQVRHLGYLQAMQGMGAQVRKGERASQIVVWKEVADKRTDDESTVMVGMGYSVFNAAQVDGYTAPGVLPTLSDAERIAAADEYFGAIGATVRHGYDRAYYQPSGDMIAMPDFAAFKGPAYYYSTLAHELTHWTGAKRRLDRTFGQRFGDSAYAAEELVAELGAAFQCAVLGIDSEPRADHAQYVAHWLKVLKADKRAIFMAASKAQAAVDYLAQQAGRGAIAEAA